MGNMKPTGIEIGLLPCIVEAFAGNTKIYGNIDEIYKTDRYAFYKLAKSSEIYNHPFIVDGNVYKEEYGRRILGILLHMSQASDQEFTDRIFKIVKKGWPVAYSLANNPLLAKYDTIDIQMIVNEKNSIEENVSELLMFSWLAHERQLPIASNEAFHKTIEPFIMRLLGATNKSEVHVYKNMSKIERGKTDELIERIFSEYGIDISFDNAIRINDLELNMFKESIYKIALMEEFDFYHLCKDDRLQENDIRDVVGTYLKMKGFSNISVFEAATYFIYGIMNRLVFKAYRQSKKHYFSRSKEYLFLEVEDNTNAAIKDYVKRFDESQKRVESLKDENRALRNGEEIKRLMAHYEEKYLMQERENAKLKEKLRQMEENEKAGDQELIGLRNRIFNMQHNVEVEAELSADELSYISDTVGVIIGGSTRWQAKMKKSLPNWVFVSSGNFDKKLFDNRQIACFSTLNLSHSFYYKAVNIAKNNRMCIGFLSQNDKLALKEIADIIERSRAITSQR